MVRCSGWAGHSRQGPVEVRQVLLRGVEEEDGGRLGAQQAIPGGATGLRSQAGESGPGRQALAPPSPSRQYLVLGDLVGHQLLQEVEVYRVAGLGAAGLGGSLRGEPQHGCEQRTPRLGGPSSPPSRATYPLVDKLELEVTLTAVRVGVCAGLQGVPVILTAAQILAGRVGKRCLRP